MSQKSNDSKSPTLGIQTQFASQSICFGCGPANSKGLRLQSIPKEKTSADLTATWMPEAHHQAFPGILNGGIIGALLDCHSNWTAAYALMLASGAENPPCTVTSDFHVKLKRPTPVDVPVELHSHVIHQEGDRATIEATLTSGGKICATCTGTFVAVKPGHPAHHRW